MGNLRAVSAAMLGVWLTGCATLSEDTGPPPRGLVFPDVDRAETAPLPKAERTAVGEDVLPEPDEAPEDRAALYPGTGRFVDWEAAKAETLEVTPEGDITLNFQNTDLRQVIDVILGDFLDANYAVDRRISGQVTLQTSQPIRKEDLLPTLEKVLAMNGAAVVRSDGLYKVVPKPEALQGGLSPMLYKDKGGLRQGFQARIVPLDYISATEMQEILEPLAPKGGVLRVDPARNLLILAGTSEQLARMQETVDVFDVNWLQGMSFGLFTLRYSDPEEVAEGLRQTLGAVDKGPMDGMFRFVPMDQLNALLVITPQKAYLEQAGKWIERLDESGAGGDKLRLYVHYLQHGRAEEMAAVLSDVFAGAVQGEGYRPAAAQELAPGLQPAEIRSQPNLTPPARETERLNEDEEPAGAQRAAGEGTAVGPWKGMRIIADEANNALLVLATAEQYRAVERALEKLDIPPLQVLVDATILEVTLSGELRYGIQWFFSGGLGEYDGEGSLGAVPDIASPTFSYTLSSAAQVRAVIQALANHSNVQVLSAPSLMVLNNQEARIKVGEQVPIITQTTTSLDADATTQTVQYRDTGVLLEVQPRVNSGGMVALQIYQEVSDPGEFDETGNRVILQRTIESTVAVENGETIVLGGLIRENRTRGESGVPILYRLPVIGKLFGATSEETRRTELVVLMTPRVVSNMTDMREVTREFRSKLQGLQAWSEEVDVGTAQVAPVAEPVRPVPGDWVVQVASYLEPERAAALGVRLRDTGYPVNVVRVPRDGRTWHRVLIGPLDSRAAAETVVRQVAEAEGLHGAVLRQVAPEAEPSPAGEAAPTAKAPEARVE